MDKDTVADALAKITEAIEDFWAALDADPDLDADERADITQLVEGAGDNLAEAKKIARDSAEKD